MDTIQRVDVLLDEKVGITRLACDDIHAHNTFENPTAVRLSQVERAPTSGNMLRVPFLAASVMRITGKLH